MIEIEIEKNSSFSILGVDKYIKSTRQLSLSLYNVRKRRMDIFGMVNFQRSAYPIIFDYSVHIVSFKKLSIGLTFALQYDNSY